jgi:hypothetical protein
MYTDKEWLADQIKAQKDLVVKFALAAPQPPPSYNTFDKITSWPLQYAKAVVKNLKKEGYIENYGE